MILPTILLAAGVALARVRHAELVGMRQLAGAQQAVKPPKLAPAVLERAMRMTGLIIHGRECRCSWRNPSKSPALAGVGGDDDANNGSPGPGQRV